MNKHVFYNLMQRECLRLGGNFHCIKTLIVTSQCSGNANLVTSTFVLAKTEVKLTFFLLCAYLYTLKKVSFLFKKMFISFVLKKQTNFYLELRL